MNPAIVVSAYRRPQALARLLAGLRTAAYDHAGVTLVISIDGGVDDARRAVLAAARDAEWPHGPKEIIDHPRHLGLIAHYFACGALSEPFGAIVFLEDDHAVSPQFHHFAARVLDAYAGDARIAHTALYALWFNGYTREPFVPLADGADVFFAQVPVTLGQVWSAAQWQRFSAWRAANAGTPPDRTRLPEPFLRFAADEWYPLLARYVAETERHVVFPRVSLATGMGDPGAHFARPTDFLQTPLRLAGERYELPPLEHALAVYDPFFEIKQDRLNRLTNALAGIDYDVDLYATKQPHQLRKPWVLSTRPARAAQRAFGRTLWPHEMNVAAETPGAQIALCHPADLRWGRRADMLARKASADYFARGRRPALRTTLLYALLDRLERRA